jgi:hypothetical protein
MLTLYTEGYGYSKRLCKDVVTWFVSKYLPRYKLEIEVLHRGLKRDGVVGYCDIAGETVRPREFLIELDTYMDKKTYVRVLSHELYHMKDFCLGNLKIKSCKKYYKGECMDDLQYWQQPSEIMAYWNEKILYQEYLNDRHLTHL